MNLTGKNSAAAMSDGELDQVIAALVAKGFVDKKKGGLEKQTQHVI
jgi:hypothetical protein